MSIFKRLYESIFYRGTRTQPIVGKTGRVVAEFSNAQVAQFFSALRDVSTEKDRRYADYKVMLNDAITRAAVKLFVEDATQTDPIRGTTVWIRSPDERWEVKANSFLQNSVQVDKIIRAIAFYTAGYGDCYLNTFSSDPAFLKENTVGSFFEVEPPTSVMEIQKFGKTCGFYVDKMNNQTSRSTQEIILDPSNFIHFSMNQGFMSQKVDVPYLDPVSGLKTSESFLAVLGESLLESARADFRLRQLFDFLIVLSRYNKSSFYRLFGVEVGDSDAADARQILKSFTDSIETRQSMDMFLGVLNMQAAPIKTGGNVYYTTREGKGSVSVETVGGDSDVKALADADMFSNRYFGALSVPKQFLGQAEDLPGGIGDSTLTRLDIKYGRTVKSLQAALRIGFKDLMYWKAENVDHCPPPPFEVCMPPIATVDDDEKQKAAQEKLDRLNGILDTIDKLGLLDDENFDKKAVAKYLVKEFSEDKRLEGILFKEHKKKEEQEETESEDEDVGGFGTPARGEGIGPERLF